MVCWRKHLLSPLFLRPGFGRVIWRGVRGQFSRCAGVWLQQPEEQRISATGERHQETQVKLHSCTTFHLLCLCVVFFSCVMPCSAITEASHWNHFNALGRVKTLTHQYCLIETMPYYQPWWILFGSAFPDSKVLLFWYFNIPKHDTYQTSSQSHNRQVPFRSVVLLIVKMQLHKCGQPFAVLNDNHQQWGDTDRIKNNVSIPRGNSVITDALIHYEVRVLIESTNWMLKAMPVLCL